VGEMLSTKLNLDIGLTQHFAHHQWDYGAGKWWAFGKENIFKCMLSIEHLL